MKIIQEFKGHYTSELRREGYSFHFVANWNESKLKASIKVPKKKAILTISGGYARQTLMTPDTFRLVLCHELGHILGGAPKKGPNHLASVEGQADYYSTAKCMRRVIPNSETPSPRFCASLGEIPCKSPIPMTKRGTIMPLATPKAATASEDILPAINTGIAHKTPGIGMVGAGLVKPPKECFVKAFKDFVAGLE